MKQALLTFLLGIFGMFSFAQQDTTTEVTQHATTS